MATCAGKRRKGQGQSSGESEFRRGGTHLEGVVDEPLEGGEGTDHNNTGSKSSPESSESNLAVDGADSGLGLAGLEGSVELGNHGVGGVGDNGAEDTSNVTREDGWRGQLVCSG